MIVCSCRAVSDAAVRAALEAGASYEDVVAATGAGTDCGHCREMLADLVAESGSCECKNACPGCPRRVAA